MKIQLDHNSQTCTLDLAQTGKTKVVMLDGQTCTVEILRAEEGRLVFRFSASSASPSASSASVSAFVSVDGVKRWVTVNGQTFVFALAGSKTRRDGVAHHAAGELRAPMPGQIRAVPVAEGEWVQKGQTLVILEAMKMELKVAAPFEGVVKTVKVRPGQTVEKDEVLAEVESRSLDEHP